MTEAWMAACARRRTRRLSLSATVAVAAAVVLAWMLIPRPPNSGQLIASERTIVELGQRAVAVADPGAELSWTSTARDGWRVRHNHGIAFYRVDSGAPFTVETPEGTIVVTGTCFTVEVHDMNTTTKQTLKSLGIATATAATVVTLYEGGVIITDASGHEVELEPGQRGALLADERPRVLGAEDETAAQTPQPDRGHADLTGQWREREVSRLRDDLAVQREEVEVLEAELAAIELPEGSQAWVEACATKADGVPECSNLEPSPDVLEEMARCGAVKVDMPPFLYNPIAEIDGSMLGLDDAGLDPRERDAVLVTARSWRDDFDETYIALARETGIPLEVAESMPSIALDIWLRTDLSGAGDLQEIYDRIARERAGQLEPRPPEQWSLAEELIRHHAEAGDRLEAAIADVIGPERARDLRRRRDGWGTVGAFPGRCQRNYSHERND